VKLFYTLGAPLFTSPVNVDKKFEPSEQLEDCGRN